MSETSPCDSWAINPPEADNPPLRIVPGINRDKNYPGFRGLVFDTFNREREWISVSEAYLPLPGVGNKEDAMTTER